MRTLIAILLSLVFVLGLTAGDKTKSIISVKGMEDDSCVEKITNALDKIEGVDNVSVNLESGQITIEHNNEIDMVSINSAISKAGYKTNHKNSEKHHGVEAEEESCSEAEKAGCGSPCGRKR